MSYYLKESPLLQQLIHQMAECNEDDLSYELWRDVCIKNGWIEVNIQPVSYTHLTLPTKLEV